MGKRSTAGAISVGSRETLKKGVAPLQLRHGSRASVVTQKMNRRSEKRESPEVAKMSHATAISLGLAHGRMYRGAVNRCANLLVHYAEGCSANCAYCGLARKRQGTYLDKSFIHVEWPVFRLDTIVEAIQDAPPYVNRTCISMITNGKSRRGTLEMAERLGKETSLPVSVLLAPTIIEPGYLRDLKGTGVDKVGIAIDLVTPELFDTYRGSGVKGPHRWETYWKTLDDSLDVFGAPHVGVHLMVGMGETEAQMVSVMDSLWEMGVANHLFAFFAEENSQLSDRPQPLWPVYLRVQLARYLIEADISYRDGMGFDDRGRILDFGVGRGDLNRIIREGIPFMTTGCLGTGGNVACNRPFGNCLPDVIQYNYPYPPNAEEISLIRDNIFHYD